LKVKLPTGEPDAGEPPVRFGGRGSLKGLFLPLLGAAKDLRFRWDETAGLVERYSVHNALKGAIGDQP
jgi:hypothetical protein